MSPVRNRNPLDDLLPLIKIDQPELHLHAAILEVAEISQLAEIAAHPKLRGFLLGRLSDTAALVDPGCAADLAAALRLAGHTPKVVEGGR